MGRHPSQAVEADVPRVEDAASNDHDEVNQGHTPSNETRNFVEHVVEAEIRQKKDLVEAQVAGPDEVAADVAGIAQPGYSRGVTAQNSIEPYLDEEPVTPNTSSNDRAELNKNEATPSNEIRQFVEQVVEANILKKQDLRDTQVAGAAEVADEVAGMYLDDEPTSPNEHLVADNLHEAGDPRPQAAPPVPAPAPRRQLATPGAFAVEGIGASPRPDDMSPRPEDMMEERSPSPVNPPDIEAADGNVDLVEAIRVSENNPLTEAQEVNQAQLEQKEANGWWPLPQIGCAVLVLVAIVVGITAGTLRHSKDTSNTARAEETQAPGTYSRTVAEALNIEWEISYVLGRGYFDHSSASISQSRQNAMHWILYEDPLQLNSSHTQQLVQRFILVLVYFQTTQRGLWSECNPSIDSATALCYYPEKEDWKNPGDIWGEVWLSHAHECRWAGVVCNEKQDITTMRLRHNRLSGPLPWEISRLSHLEVLDLSYNSLTGTVPVELESLATTSLSDFWLSWNELEGQVPKGLFINDHWANTTDYRNRLDLAGNLFTGEIPTEIGRAELNHISLKDNLLSGSLPAEVFLSSNLETLSLEGNVEIEGSVPTEIGLSTNLRKLLLGRTALTGFLPSEMALMTSLTSLSLFNTKLGGTIPEEIYSGLSGLHRLDVNGCHFSGTISTSLGLWSDLDELHIAHNEFSGSLPSEMGKMIDLYVITLNGNQFTSESVPEALCDLKRTIMMSSWQLVADCLPDETTGVARVECPEQCCTTCCDPSIEICLSI